MGMSESPNTTRPLPPMPSAKLPLLHGVVQSAREEQKENPNLVN